MGASLKGAKRPTIMKHIIQSKLAGTLCNYTLLFIIGLLVSVNLQMDKINIHLLVYPLS